MTCFYMILWTSSLLFFRSRFLNPDIFCEDRPFISAGDWKFAGKEVAYFLAYPHSTTGGRCRESVFWCDYADDLPEILGARRPIGIAPGRPVFY